jgi:GcrA cell cycle regulator
MPSPSTVNDIWTQDKIDALKEHWGSGMAAGQIGSIIGASRSAVLGKVRRLKLPGHGPQRVSPGRQHGNKGQPKANAIVARAARRKPSAPPASEPLDMEDGPYTDVTHLLGIMDLDRGDCRWPVSGEGSATLFCGAKAHHGPYCPEHSARAGSGYGKGARP